MNNLNNADKKESENAQDEISIKTDFIEGDITIIRKKEAMEFSHEEGNDIQNKIITDSFNIYEQEVDNSIRSSDTGTMPHQENRKSQEISEKGFLISGLQDSIDSRTSVFVFGKKGVGKSSLIELVKDKWEYASHRIPCFIEVAIEGSPYEILIKALQSSEKQMGKCVSQNQVLVLVIGAPDRAIAQEQILVESIRFGCDNPSILLVLNRIDLIPPARVWEPNSFSPGRPETNKDLSIIKWSEHMRSTLKVDSVNTLLSCADEDSRSIYGIETLVKKLSDVAPTSQIFGSSWLGTSSGEIEDYIALERQAKKLVASAAVAAGGSGLLTKSMLDIPFVLTIQTALLIRLFRLYGVEWKYVSAFVSLLAGAAAERSLQTLISRLVPGTGEVISAATAASTTAAVGHAYLYFLQRGNPTPTPHEFADKVRELHLNK